MIDAGTHPHSEASHLCALYFDGVINNRAEDGRLSGVGLQTGTCQITSVMRLEPSACAFSITVGTLNLT